MTDPVVPPTHPEPSPSWSDRVGRLRSHLPIRPPGNAALAGLATAAAAVVIVVVVVLRQSSAPRPLVLPRAGSGPGPGNAQPAVGDGQGASGGGTDQPAGTVTVHAAGAVAKPGLYVVPSRARVADVLAAAGGALADANVDQLNLAAKLTDAERIYVPRKGEAPAALPADSPGAGVPTGNGVGTPAGPIDLNTADATQLDVLPGVGPTTAKAIVTYRSTHGRFRSVTDLLGVPGIGPAKLDTIRPS
ncbi:MAG: helix-hairpin-helix domain-containing protein [Actinomycetota bacterium]|nr:helix-hairpin-helix domain-containing protein [Actinomycetota bacterium]